LPENTAGREGFLHPNSGKLEVEESSIKLLLRDFDKEGLNAKEKVLRDAAEQTGIKFPQVQVVVEIRDDYENMYEVLKTYPHLTEYAREAAKKAGLVPMIKPTRGGTDGAILTFKGLPCPNLFTGGHNFHGKLEFNSRGGLEKTTETLLNLVQLFTKKDLSQPTPTN
jgi:tripeptide aminopeptidase